MKVLRKKYFYLSSANRQRNESINNFSIMVPPNLMALKQDEKLRVVLTSFTTINSLQNINNNNNSFTLTITYFSNGSYTTIIRNLNLPNGNYTISQIASNLTALLTISTLVGGSITTVVNPYTNTCQWQYNTWAGFLITTLVISFNPIPNVTDSAMRILGFSGNTTIISPSTPFVYNTPLPMYSGQEPLIQLHADIPTVNVAYNANNNMLNYSDILATIPILAPPYSPIVYQTFDSESFTFEMPSFGHKLGTINFYVTNKNGVPLLMLDDYQFVLKIEVLKDDEKEHLDVAKNTLDLLKLQALTMENYYNR